jgi:Flp pilus assembly protein TadB
VTRQRHLRWGLPEQPVPKHPYRDSVLVYGFFALVVVLLAWVTGGSVVRGVVVAAAVWVAASLWSIVRWRERLRREAAARRVEQELEP